MLVLGLRFCTVDSNAEKSADVFDSLGLKRHYQYPKTDSTDFAGAVFLAGGSRIEVWDETEDLPAGIMLQILVDDADEFAEYARSNGLQPDGPLEAHGERIYFLRTPSGLHLSFQSKLVGSAEY